jgi:Tfp pilus assembly protein PilZ
VTTFLDLLREFAALNDAKLRRGGMLSPEDEKRWAELKILYDRLMSLDGLEPAPRRSFSPGEVARLVTDRDRLRVRSEMSVTLVSDGLSLAARTVNLSKSGAFVASETLLEVGARLALYLFRADGGPPEVLELKGEVSWRSEAGVKEVGLPRGMGIHFLDTSPELMERLDALVVETLERQLARF